MNMWILACQVALYGPHVMLEPKKPEDFGDYFAWGETQPKTDYSYETYKYGNCKNHTEYNKYNYGYVGDTDNLITLEAGDDAATVNWGNGWRMPTKDECEELLKCTTKKVVTIHGVKGMRFTGTNGNSVFLPSAGRFRGSKLKDNDKKGEYWSNTRSTLNTIENYVWYFWYDDSGYCETHAYDIREFGSTIRPVCSASK